MYAYSADGPIGNPDRQLVPMGSMDTCNSFEAKGSAGDLLAYLPPTEAGRYLNGMGISQDGDYVLIITGNVAYNLSGGGSPSRYFYINSDFQIIKNGDVVCDTDSYFGVICLSICF
jgi:hypothetical protein